MITELSYLLFISVMTVTFLSVAAYVVFFITQRSEIRSAGRMILIFSGVLQTLYIIVRFVQAGHVPLTTQHEAVFFYAWATTWAYLSFRWRYTVKNFGTVVAILILGLLCSSTLTTMEVSELVPALQSGWLPIHAGVSLLAYGFLSLAFCGGLMYLLQERELKRKKFGYLFERLPSLDALDQLNSHCLTVGFIFLTLGMVTGILWAKQAWGTYWKWDPKETWSVITWFIYLIQIHQRFTVGWRGKRAAVMAIAGFGAVIFTFWGVTYLLGGEHIYAK